jgi:hypothetical protein
MTEQFHFFASSLTTWRALPDLREVIKFMDKEQLTYNVWYLPVPHDTDYDITYYTPQVEGRIYLGTYYPMTKKAK